MINRYDKIFAHYIADIVIVGGGIAGLSLALALSKTNLKIIVLDKTSLQVEYDCGQHTRVSTLNYDLRVSALNQASRQLFETINIWDELVSTEKVTPLKNMLIWEEDGTGNLDFNVKLSKRNDNLGFIVENSLMREILLSKLAQTQVKLISNATLTDILQWQNTVQLTIDNKKLVQSTLVIGADGAVSTVRQLLNIPTREWDYPHKAIVTTVKTEKKHQFTARQIFLNTGPLAFLPLYGDEHYCSIVWSLHKGYAEDVQKQPESLFKDQLAKKVEWALGKVLTVDQRQLLVLKQRHAKTYYQGRVILIGDAAHTIHPLAGQGLNLGLADVSVLSRILQKTYQKTNNPILLGDRRIIEKYQRRRQQNNLVMMSAMEGIYRLFESQSTTLKLARNIGLHKTNSFSFIKRKLVKVALGL